MKRVTDGSRTHLRHTKAGKSGRAGKSPLLQTYLHLIQPQTYSPHCPLCKTKEHTTQHLFECYKLIPTTLTTLTLWTDPPAAAELLFVWRSALDEGGGSPD